MTLEQKALIEVGDIQAVEVECLDKDCGWKFCIPVEQATIPIKCPQCQSNWMVDNAGPNTPDGKLDQLLSTLRGASGALRQKEDESKFKLRLELRYPAQP